MVLFLGFTCFIFATLNGLDYGVLGCELVPGNPSGSCMDLRSVPFVSSSGSKFGPFIEGTGVNPRGDIFSVNYGDASKQNLLGQVAPSQRLFYTDSVQSSLLNGIRFLNESVAYIADAVGHRVLKLNLQNEGDNSVVTSSGVFCSDPTMLQPNDLTLAINTGVVITSGMKWLADTDNTSGDIWACLPSGETKRLELMGRTNGIDLSPEENFLYVSESYNRGGNPYIQKIWKYNFNAVQGSISGKSLFADFAQIDGTQGIDIDGMKTDTRGNLYVTRHGGSQVIIFNPAGSVIGKIRLSFSNPTNLEFGGTSGTSLFIVGKCNDNAAKGCVDKIELANPGRSWSLLQRKCQ